MLHFLTKIDLSSRTKGSHLLLHLFSLHEQDDGPRIRTPLIPMTRMNSQLYLIVVSLANQAIRQKTCKTSFAQQVRLLGLRSMVSLLLHRISGLLPVL